MVCYRTFINYVVFGQTEDRFKECDVSRLRTILWVKDIGRSLESPTSARIPVSITTQLVNDHVFNVRT